MVRSHAYFATGCSIRACMSGSRLHACWRGLRSSGEGHAAGNVAGGADPPLAADAGRVQFRFEQTTAFECGVGSKMYRTVATSQ